MKTDRELLELAARAADVPYKALPHSGSCWEKWDPLNDDGDALRLAVKLRLEIDMDDKSIAIRHSSGIKILESFKTDPYSATRRAIVRAAAAIGEEMK